jgi:hypothetical protein
MTRTVVHYVDSDTNGGCEEVVLLLLSGLDKTSWRPMKVEQGSYIGDPVWPPVARRRGIWQGLLRQKLQSKGGLFSACTVIPSSR